ncbi:MAG: hypothetical protein IIC01_11410 [Planctomycetes bacterium]|nr:hypothetical protein [Planctomycetota bacterium]
MTRKANRATGTVYKKTYTKPLPPDAEAFTRKGERFARWKDAKGKSLKQIQEEAAVDS